MSYFCLVGTRFYKYQGTGNDFVVLDGREWPEAPTVEWIKKICHRKWGVGSDGLVIVRPSASHDFHVDFYNPDGSQSFCGNGSRCAVAFFVDRFETSLSQWTFSAFDGVHSATQEGNQISISMQEVMKNEETPKGCFIHTGSPHVIVEVKNLDEWDVHAKGAEIRYDEYFTSINGTNVNFIENKLGQWYLRTYERGVEAETLSCGTGVTASALYVLEKLGNSGRVVMNSQGGRLEVSAIRQGPYHFTNVYLIGPAQKVFEGIWEH